MTDADIDDDGAALGNVRRNGSVNGGGENLRVNRHRVNRRAVEAGGEQGALLSSWRSAESHLRS